MFFAGAMAHCFSMTYAIFNYQGEHSTTSSSSSTTNSAIHGSNTTDKSMNSNDDEKTILNLSTIFSGPSKYIKAAICATSMLSSPIAQMLHPAAKFIANNDVSSGNKSGMKSARDVTQFEIAGIAQYITVGLYIMYFGSYSMDLIRIRSLAKKSI
jgi:hypothetical protein